MKIVFGILIFGAVTSGTYLLWRTAKWLFTPTGNDAQYVPLISDDDIQRRSGFSLFQINRNHDEF